MRGLGGKIKKKRRFYSRQEAVTPGRGADSLRLFVYRADHRGDAATGIEIAFDFHP